MLEKKLTPEKQKEWDEVMEQIRADIDALPPYASGYFNNAAVAEEHDAILTKYTERLNKILGRNVQKRDISKKSERKRFSDLITQNPHGFPDLPKK